MEDQPLLFFVAFLPSNPVFVKGKTQPAAYNDLAWKRDKLKNTAAGLFICGNHLLPHSFGYPPTMFFVQSTVSGTGSWSCRNP
ncbi:MAG: hypothetical protein DRH37_06470 [Deltaproteobacteria bacterium]|nr:MAG: hypothetical protein DRH37_06470 [Deltaproteobacteria bacterium]